MKFLLDGSKVCLSTNFNAPRMKYRLHQMSRYKSIRSNAKVCLELARLCAQ